MSWWSRALVPLVFGLVGLACASSESGATSRIELVIDADPALRAELDRIEIKGQSELAFDLRAAGTSAGKQLPFVVSVGASEGKPRRSLQIRAFTGQRERVRRSLDITLAPGARRLLGVYLTGSCLDVFERCDAMDLGTCLPCEASCGSTNVNASDLLALDDGQAPLSAWQAPECGEGSLPDAQVPTDGMTPGDGATDGLSLTVPAVVAAPGCVPVRLNRADPGGAADVTLDSHDSGAFFKDNLCSDELASPAFANGKDELAVWFAPILPTGSVVGSGMLSATAFGVTVDRAIEIRTRAKQVIRGIDFACVQVADSDGSLYCMGWDAGGRMGFDGQKIAPRPTKSPNASGLGVWARLASYSTSSCALLLDGPGDQAGPVKCWGPNTERQLGSTSMTAPYSPVPVTVDGLSDASQLSVGEYHACAVTSDSKLVCWGDNSAASLEDAPAPELLPSATPISKLSGVSGGDVVRGVATGAATTCASLANGKVYCWGRGSPFFNVAPILAFDLPATPKHIAIGQTQACAVTAGDELYCWNESSGTAARVNIPGLPDAAALDGLQLSFNGGCVRANGELYCWGANPEGWLGTASTTNPLIVPSKVALPGKVESFAIGGFQELQLSAVVDGLVYAWGDALGGNFGSLGVELGLDDYLLPTRNSALDGAAQLMLSAFPGCTIATDGALACWGHGSEVGNGKVFIRDGAFASRPTRVAGLGTNVSQVEGGDSWTLVRHDDKAVAFGSNFVGQLGRGTLEPSGSPSVVSLSDAAVLDVSAGQYNACALLQTGVAEREVRCWGAWGGDGLTLPTTVLTFDDTLTDVDVTSARGCALVGDAVRCWTYSYANTTFTITPAPSPLDMGVTALDMHDGDSNTLCALKADNSAWCGFYGAAPTLTFEDVQSVRAGAGHACAKPVAPRAGKQLLCAGSNDHGQLGNGLKGDSLSGSGAVSGLTGEVSAYATGGRGSCARDDEGWKCWGSNQRNGLAFSDVVVSTPMLIAPWQP